MTGSCCHSKSASKFFNFFARSYRKRFQKKGFEDSQEQLLNGLADAGFGDASLLEIGCGVGHLHQTMLEQGAATATGVDLGEEMLKQARDWAEERGIADRVDYREGDFMDIARNIEPVDVCFMDKVICCYPDADGLVRASLEKTKRVYAVTYPRDRWFVHLSTVLWNIGLWLLRSDFRTYMHDPRDIERWILESGMRKQSEDTTASWLTQVYVRI